jgi:Putative DNA-binding domain
MLPPDWQRQMVEQIRGAQPAAGDWFSGGPGLSPTDQLEVYREQFRLRLIDAVVEELPGLCHLLGDGRDEVLWAYLQDHPPHTWTLNRVADHMPAWLEARGGSPAQVQMASLDLLVSAGFEAGAPRPLEPASLLGAPYLRRTPPTGLLHLSWSVHQVRSAVVGGTAPLQLEPGDWHLVVFRRGLRMRHLEIEPPLWRILAALDGTKPLDQALGEGLQGGDLPADLGGALQRWFRQLAELELVEVVS